MSCKCEDISISEMRHRITIEVLALTPNDSGGASEAWTTHATVWSRVKAKSGGEVNFGNRIEPRTTHEITLRYLATVTESMRVQFEGATMEIKSILPDETKTFMLLRCIQRTGT